jgi:RNA polymerase sigma-70 factor (ECF subfamily)
MADAAILTPVTGAAEALERLARSRDARAWEWLLAELGPAIRLVAHRLSVDQALGDDAVQETLLTLRDRASAFRLRPGADADGQARRWILRVAANAALQLSRRHRRAQARDRATAAPEPQPPVADQIERAETARLVRDELAALREAERTAIVLHVVAGLGFEEVAAELRCPVGTAKTRVHRGLERMRRGLARRRDQFAMAALVASLQRPVAAAPLAGDVLTGTGSAASGSALPTTVGGMAMVTKIAVALAAALLVTAPTAMALRAQEAGPAAAAGSAPSGSGGAEPHRVKSSPVAGARGQAPATASVARSPFAAATGDPAWDTSRLEQRVTAAFQESSLPDITAFLSKVCGGTWRIEGFADGTPAPTATLRVTDMRLRSLIEWVAQLSGCAWTLRRDGVIFSPRGSAELKKTLAMTGNGRINDISWSDTLDMLRTCGIPVLDCGNDEEAQRRLAHREFDSDLRALLDGCAADLGTTWTEHDGWVVFGTGQPGRMTAQERSTLTDHLNQRVSVHFENTGLVDVVAFLGQVSAQNIVLDPRIGDGDPPVTLQTRDMALQDCLNWILKLTSLHEQLRSGAIYITPDDWPVPAPKPAEPTAPHSNF